MKFSIRPLFAACCFLVCTANLMAQDSIKVKQKNAFWERVRFGGGFGAAFGSDYSNFSLSPGAVYEINQHFGIGVGLQASYVKVDGDYNQFSDNFNNYKSWIYGGSIIGLFNIIEQVQLSLEVEQVRVNSTFSIPNQPDFSDDFWNTALFAGAGYRTDNVTFGLRYNLLYDKDKSVYYEPFMPFVRVYF